MKKTLVYILLLCSLFAQAQNWTAAMPHVTSITGVPSASGSWIRLNTTTGQPHQWNPNTVSWVIMPDGIDVITGSIPPAYTPSYQQSDFAINAVDSLYRYRSGEWRHINPGGGGGGGGGTWGSITGTLSAQTDLQSALDGKLSAEVDGSATNEGGLSVGAGSGTTSTIVSNTSGSTSVTISASTGLSISEAGSTITLTNSAPDQTVSITGGGINSVTGTYPSFTVTGTEVDGSITNEIQDLTNASDATSHTVTLNMSGGSIQLVEGANVTLTTTGTVGNGIVTIAATGDGGMTALTGDVTASGSGSVSATVTGINGTSLAGLATGILKNTTTTGVPSIAVAGDFPTLNQNTTGSAATLTTPRAIYGNNFDGSADLTQIIASTYGGTGNGFAKFSGPTTTEKTFTLPNASATILTDNNVVTAVQGGTGNNNYAIGDILQASAGTTLSKLAAVATGNVLISGGITTVSSWGKVGLTTHVSGILPGANGGTNNAFMSFTGPSSGSRVFTLPNATATILTSNTAVTVAQGGTGRATSTTAYGLLAAGTTATGAHQTLAAGATTAILVGGGASALPQWTTATGSGSPVRATSPALVTPDIGTPTAGTLTSCTGLPLTTGITGTLAVANGGTGATTLTGLLQGNGTGAVTAITNSSTVGQVLKVTGASTYAWADDLPYKVYSATITQTGTSAPVSVVMQNTLGVTPTWARSGTGQYTLTATGAWVTAKTTLPNSSTILAGDDSDEYASTHWVRTSADVLTLVIVKNTLDGIIEMNNTTEGIFIEIRVYN